MRQELSTALMSFPTATWSSCLLFYPFRKKLPELLRKVKEFIKLCNKKECVGIFYFLIPKLYAHIPCTVDIFNTRNPQSLYPRNMMCCVHSEVCLPKLLAILPKLWWVMLPKSEETAVGWCANAKLSAKRLHLTCMAMAESCPVTGVSMEGQVNVCPSKG